MIVRTYQMMKILLFQFWVRSKNMVAAHFSLIMAIFLHMKSEVLRCWTCAQLWSTCNNVLEEALAKFLPPLIHFHR